jgi:rare lipoprotein A
MVRAILTRRLACVVWAGAALALSGCAAKSSAPKPVATTGTLEVHEGLASYYGPGFAGRPTASGVIFDSRAMMAAHPNYPFGTVVRVTNLRNGRAVDVRILDRGPAAGPRAAGVLIDVSYGAAERLGFIRAGRTRVRLEVLRWGDRSSRTR